MTGREGFTLVEILVAVVILGILATMAVTSFLGLSEKYKVETETKQLYADLMDARGRAMQRNRFHFVRITANGYATYGDSSPSPDGNGIYNSGLDNPVANVTVKHTITPVLALGSPNFEFNRNGIASDTGYIRFSSTANPDYDCITIRETRTKMGKYDATAGICVEK
jgi:type IV fimbrial biogenesis protein FimT